jgi:hypothetical protein
LDKDLSFPRPRAFPFQLSHKLTIGRSYLGASCFSYRADEVGSNTGYTHADSTEVGDKALKPSDGRVCINAGNISASLPLAEARIEVSVRGRLA